MTFFDDEHPIRKPAHEIGCDLSMLSADELGERIELLRRELERLEAERERKTTSRSAAESVFR